MNIRSWASESLENVRKEGYLGLRKSLRPVYHLALSQTTPFFAPGENIFDHEWDLLIILDACRYDLMYEVASETNFIKDIGDFRRVNSATVGWMRDTFPNRSETSETMYVCGNPFSESELDSTWFKHLHEVWRDAWTDPGTVPPRSVTDETIRAMREQDSSRVIAHYMQPHCPFIPRPNLSKGKNLKKFGKQDHRDVWGLYRDGVVSKSELWDGYRKNLKLVLDDVQLLLNNVDAPKAIISSDHGNAMGKWGIYGHPINMSHESLRKVPWIEVEAEDQRGYEPSNKRQNNEINREQQLKSLGYL